MQIQINQASVRLNVITITHLMVLLTTDVPNAMKVVTVAMIMVKLMTLNNAQLAQRHIHIDFKIVSSASTHANRVFSKGLYFN